MGFGGYFIYLTLGMYLTLESLGCFPFWFMNCLLCHKSSVYLLSLLIFKEYLEITLEY